MKKLSFIQKNNSSHWVGNGFPVRSIFSYHHLAKELSPFLLLDYAGPVEFSATSERRGVGAHPHRGFETVTIVYSGEVEHRDSSGSGGTIGPGDVQWMSAASGLVHEEFHGKNFAQKGGRFEMIQLWVNLPKEFKMQQPNYQGIQSCDIPTVHLPEGQGLVKVIAGEFHDQKGAASTYSPVNLWDMRLTPGTKGLYRVPEGHTAALFVLEGKVRLSGGEEVHEAQIAVLERESDSFSLEALEASKVLFLGGKPINEPVVGQGPFVMNTQEEIYQAMSDYHEGKMGKL